MGRGRATETLLGSSIILSLILAVYRDDAGWQKNYQGNYSRKGNWDSEEVKQGGGKGREKERIKYQQ